jgi:hypothetical protein
LREGLRIAALCPARPPDIVSEPVMTRGSSKARVRAALLVLVPAIFITILAPRGSIVQGIALVLLLLALSYLVTLWIMVHRAR